MKKHIEKVHQFMLVRISMALSFRSIRQSFYMSFVANELPVISQKTGHLFMNSIFEKEFALLQMLYERTKEYLLTNFANDKNLID